MQTALESDVWVAPSGKPGEAGAITSGAGTSDGRWGISWTPDGRLVYVSTASGNRDIWSMDISGGGRKQLTSDAGQNYWPVVTPDGRSIMFFSDRGEDPGLWRMEIDGSSPRQLIKGPIQERAACSPGGKWVIYSTTGRAGIPALWKVGVDGGEPVQLNARYWAELPTVSPDGKQVALQFFEMGRASAIGLIPIEGERDRRWDRCAWSRWSCTRVTACAIAWTSRPPAPGGDHASRCPWPRAPT